MVCFKDLEIGDFFLDTEHDFPGIKISENMYFNRKTKKIYHTILGDIYIFKKCDPENTRPHGEWIPVTYRPMTEEEEKELCVKWGIKEGSLEKWEKRVFTCPLPDDGQEILISHGAYVQEDICSWYKDCCGLEYGCCGLATYGDWDGVDAWMPLPEPYKKEGEWVDYSEEGFIECPFCHKATTCEDNIDELHYCWNCGAKLRKGDDNETEG